MLAIETSGKVSGAAVMEGDVLRAELMAETPLTHSETLQSHIAAVLDLARVSKKKITAVAVNIGPGSFTGLRIGLAAAKAMAYALNVPLVGVPATHVLAAQFFGIADNILAMIDAQKKNVYREILHWEGTELTVVKAMEVVSLAKALDECKASAAPTVVLGDGLRKSTADLPSNAVVAPPQLRLPRAAHVAWLGIKKLTKGEVLDSMTAEPVYLRRSEAEILWEQRHGGN